MLHDQSQLILLAKTFGILKHITTEIILFAKVFDILKHIPNADRSQFILCAKMFDILKEITNWMSPSDMLAQLDSNIVWNCSFCGILSVEVRSWSPALRPPSSFERPPQGPSPRPLLHPPGDI